MQYSHNSTVRELIDHLFALQWCQENLVCPIQIYEQNPSTGITEKGVYIAIGNFSYLATIGDFIKSRCQTEGLKTHFIEEDAEAILSRITKAANDRQDSATKSLLNTDTSKKL